MLKDGLDPMIGQDIHVAIARLGYPQEQRQIAGDTVYLWSNQAGLPPVGLVDALLDGPPSCEIEIAVNHDNIIREYHFHGGNSACGPYAIAVGRK
jgi:hypothetical protein